MASICGSAVVLLDGGDALALALLGLRLAGHICVSDSGSGSGCVRVATAAPPGSSPETALLLQARSGACAAHGQRTCRSGRSDSTACSGPAESAGAVHIVSLADVVSCGLLHLGAREGGFGGIQPCDGGLGLGVIARGRSSALGGCEGGVAAWWSGSGDAVVAIRGHADGGLLRDAFELGERGGDGVEFVLGVGR